MRVHLITIGDELLIGQTTNTNAAWLGEQLSLIGVDVTRGTTVGDEAWRIHQELDRAYAEADLAITTGGLGPTHDDVTRRAVATYFGRSLRTHPALLQRIETYYANSGRAMPDAAQALAQVPKGFDLLDNPIGTAPGLWGSETMGDGERLVAVLPGIPQEMKAIVRSSLVPRLRERADLHAVEHRTLKTTGIGETSLQQQVGDLSDYLNDTLHLAYLPSTSGVRLRLSAYGSDRDEAKRRLQTLEEVLRARVGSYIFGTGDDELEAILGQRLTEQGLTLATAESCTGGLVAHRLTNVSGSSAYMIGSVVAYSNRVKVDQLGVDPAVLEAHGAVSEPVARQMAQGVREALGTDIGISTTGIAGPTGGTPEKPVGTVWLGYADERDVRTVQLQFTQDRQLNKELFSTSALDLIRRHIRDSASVQT